MRHHKAHTELVSIATNTRIYISDPVHTPDTFTDDYKNRARAAAVVKMRVAEDLTYFDLGLVEPEGSRELIGEKLFDHCTWKARKVRPPTRTAISLTSYP